MKKKDIVCPKCNSNTVVGNGNYKFRKRYKCRNCGKSFNDMTGNIYASIQNTEKLDIFSKKLLMGNSIKYIAEELNVSVNTLYHWKKKIMSSLSK